MKNIARIVFGALILFEFLNWIGFLNFSLDYSWLGLIFLALVILIILEVFGFPQYIWWTALAGVVLDAVSDVFHLYTAVSWWDRMIHFSSGVLIGIVVLHVLLRLRRKGMLHFEKWLAIPAIIAAVSLLGLFYEYWEFLIDKFYFQGTHASLGDGVDTVDDQMLNLLGASIVALAYYIKSHIIWKRSQ